MRNKFLVLLVSALLGFSLYGCQNTQTRAVEGGVIGGALGAIAGGVIGHQDHHGAEGALIGAAVGAVGGAAVGAQIEKPQANQTQVPPADMESAQVE